MITKKDFIAIARIINQAREADYERPESAISHIELDLADYFSAQNPRFDRKKFLFASGHLD